MTPSPLPPLAWPLQPERVKFSWTSQIDGLYYYGVCDLDEIFSVISNHFISRAEDLAIIAKTCYSYEEWATWEAYLACCRRCWTVAPRPRYSKHGVDCEDYADLYIKTTSTSALIEIAILHLENGPKWVDKIAADTCKLQRISAAGIQCLQVLILASAKTQIDESSWWQNLLRRIPLWKSSTSMKRDCPLGERGQLIVAAWEILPSEPKCELPGSES